MLEQRKREAVEKWCIDTVALADAKKAEHRCVKALG